MRGKANQWQAEVKAVMKSNGLSFKEALKVASDARKVANPTYKTCQERSESSGGGLFTRKKDPCQVYCKDKSLYQFASPYLSHKHCLIKCKENICRQKCPRRDDQCFKKCIF